ncbi:hypothetical protein Tco_1135995 [Tanacetum coccineum]
MFDRAFKRVNTFEDFRTELCLEITPDEEEVIIDTISLVVKSPSIVVWKIHKEGRKSYYQIIRADGKSQMYMIFSHMLKSFDREDLETFYKLVKAKYKSTKPVEDLDLVLWNDLKTMFEPHVEDAVWRNQQDYKVLSWKLYDSCGVHFLRMQHMQIYMLVEKKYPLTPSTLSMMLEKKLMIDYESEMAYQLLKFTIKQLKKEFHNEASSGWRIDELLDLRFKSVLAPSCVHYMPLNYDSRTIVASDDLRDALSVIFGLSELKVGDEAVHKELGDRMERAATTASSLEAKQDSGSGPRCQDTILGDVDAQTRFETTSKQSNDPPLSKVNIFGSREDSMQLMELMTHCTKLSVLVSQKK